MKAILSSLALLLSACAPASAQFPSEASKSAVVSTAITMLAPHSECGALIQRVKTLQPYLGKSVDSSAGDEKFWREYGQSYEGIWDTWSPCVGAAMQSKAIFESEKKWAGSKRVYSLHGREGQKGNSGPHGSLE